MTLARCGNVMSGGVGDVKSTYGGESVPGL